MNKVESRKMWGRQKKNFENNKNKKYEPLVYGCGTSHTIKTTE